MTPYSEIRKRSVPLIYQLPLDHPLGVLICLTNSCNLSCEFCPKSRDDYYEKVGGRASLPDSLVSKVIDELSEAGLKSLRLYGIGEPLLSTTLENHIAHGKRKGWMVEGTTNGKLLNRERACKLLTSGLDYLRVSDYGDDGIYPSM